jgi:undecaprenyl-diphosphatase
MGIWEAIGLGAFQGIAEFLPISSSGHLALLQYFLGIADTPRFFDVMLHVGTLAAVLAFYRRSLWISPSELLSGKSHPGRSEEGHLLGSYPRRIVLFLLLATLPTVAAALVFRPTKIAPGASLADTEISWRNQIGDIREYASQRPEMILCFLLVTSVVLLIGARANHGTKDSNTMRWWQALLMGVAQAFSALFPGLSRSGMTVSAGMLLGLRGEWAVHFSLLMSIPAIVGAVVLKSRDLDPAWLTPQNIAATTVGTVVSALVGWFSISLLLRSVRKGQWWHYSLYLWLVVIVAYACLPHS